METAAKAGAAGFPLDATLDEASLRPFRKFRAFRKFGAFGEIGAFGWIGAGRSGRRGARRATTHGFVSLLTTRLGRFGRYLRGHSVASRASPPQRPWWRAAREHQGHHARWRRKERRLPPDDYLEALYGHPFDWDRWVGTYVLPYVEPA